MVDKPKSSAKNFFTLLTVATSSSKNKKHVNQYKYIHFKHLTYLTRTVEPPLARIFVYIGHKYWYFLYGIGKNDGR
jgi:hypothetical protein